MKKFFKILRTLSVNMTWKMFRALLSKPILLIPTIWATIESFLFSEINFDESSSGRGIPNAFRHACWNLLIAKNCAVITSEENAIHWAKFTTDLHEECFPNEPFDHEMDLHNNRIGREFYRGMCQKNIKTKKEMIAELMKKSKTAVGLSDSSEIREVKNELVYYVINHQQQKNELHRNI